MAANLVPTEGGPAIAIDKPIMLIGRNQSCDILLQSSTKISRRHCCIVQCGRKYLLRDLGSMNGVRVNTHRVTEIELRPGDEVAIADVQFTFRLDEPEKEGKPLQQQSPQDVASDKSPDVVDKGAFDKGAVDKNECPIDLADAADSEVGSNTFSDGDLPDASEGQIRLKDDSESRPEFAKV